MEIYDMMRTMISENIQTRDIYATMLMKFDSEVNKFNVPDEIKKMSRMVFFQENIIEQFRKDKGAHLAGIQVEQKSENEHVITPAFHHTHDNNEPVKEKTISADVEYQIKEEQFDKYFFEKHNKVDYIKVDKQLKELFNV